MLVNNDADNAYVWNVCYLVKQISKNCQTLMFRYTRQVTRPSANHIDCMDFISEF